MQFSVHSKGGPLSSDNGSNQPSIVYLISKLATKLTNKQEERDLKKENEKIHLIYQKLLDKKTKPRSPEQLREINLQTRLAIDFDYRSNQLYDHSNAFNLLINRFRSYKYTPLPSPSVHNRRCDLPLSEHEAVLSCLFSLHRLDLDTNVPELSDHCTDLLRITAQLNRAALSYPNDLRLFGGTKIDKYLSLDTSNMTMYPDHVFEFTDTSDNDTCQTVTQTEREMDLMNMLSQFDHTPMIDEALVTEDEPAVQQRRVETESSLYGSLVNPRAPAHTIEVQLSIPELPDLPEDVRKFALFQREVELASEFSSLVSLHKELDLTKFMPTEGPSHSAREAVDTFEAHSDTLHDLWLQSLATEGSTLASRSWDKSCTNATESTRLDYLQFDGSNIKLKVREDCATDPVLSRTMNHFQAKVERNIRVANFPVALDGLPSLIDDVLKAVLAKVPASARATLLHSVTWSMLRTELIHIDLAANTIQQFIDQILGGPLETHNEAVILDLSKREDVALSDDDDFASEHGSEDSDEFYEKYYAQLDADEETATMNEFPTTPAKSHDRQNAYNYSFFTHMSLKDQLGHLMEHDHSMIERAFAVTLEELVQTIRATVLTLPETIDLTAPADKVLEPRQEQPLNTLAHVWQDPWPLDTLHPEHTTVYKTERPHSHLPHALHAQLVTRLQLLREQTRVIADICTASPIYLTKSSANTDDIDAAINDPESDTKASERGPRLLSYLYTQAQHGDDYGFSHMLFKQTFAPYCKMIEEWLCHGKCWSDYFAEFFIVKSKHKPARDAEYWTKAFAKRDANLPVFLNDVEALIFRTGLVVNIFKDMQSHQHTRAAVSQLPKRLDLADKLLLFDGANGQLQGRASALVGAVPEPAVPIPLDLLLRESFVAVIADHHKLVNRLHLRALSDDLHMHQHFASLKFYYFGYFIEVFHQNLVSEMSERTMRTYGSIDAIMTSIRVMFKRRKLEQLFNAVVDRSLGQSTTDDPDVLMDLAPGQLFFAPQGDYAQSVSNDIFGTCQMHYTCPWPLNIVVNQGALSKYHRVFVLLFKLKRAARSLNEIWSAFQHPTRKRKAMSQHSLSIELMRQEMYHFIVTLQNYLTNQISDISWNEFQQHLTTAESFEDVIDVHNRYLDAMLTRCMLNEPAKPIQVTLDRIFAAVHQFHEQVDQYLKTETRPTQERNTALVMYIQSTKLEFRQCAKFLFTIVSALSSRGYKYDLTDLLVNLNYNSHYDRLTIK